MNLSVYESVVNHCEKLVIDNILLPSQNFSSRIERPDAEIHVRLKGHWRIQSCILLGLLSLVEAGHPLTKELHVWKLISDIIEKTDTFDLLQSAKIQSLTIKEIREDLVLFEDIFGKTNEEIFGFLNDPSTQKQIQESYRFYITVPKSPKRVQRHRGYRDKGSLGGDKKYLQSRNFDNDSKQQILIEQKRDYYYSFSELKKQILGN